MKWITMIVLGLALMLPSVASAAKCNSTSSQYSNKTCPVVSSTHSVTPSSGTPSSAPTSSASPASAGTLPFTGLDVGVLAAGGVALLGAGLVVRRLATDTGK